jgi:hypothetical protein
MRVAPAVAENDETLAPDYCDAVVGWRIWYGVDATGRVRLASPYHHAVWPHCDPLAARCVHRRVRLRPRLRRESHNAPELRCGCGIYATAAGSFVDCLTEFMGGVGSRLFDRRLIVVGRVSLWGTVVEHDLGWRASHAYPMHLFVASLRRDGVSARDLSDLAAYRVPVAVLHAISSDEMIHEVGILAGGEERTLSSS